MDRNELKTLLTANRRIAAVKSESGLSESLKTDCRVIFILYGNVMNICDIVKRVKDANKMAFVHIDLIEGLSAKEIAVEFLANNTGADGIISTKQPLIKSAAAHGLLTVQRFFLIDSLALDNLKKQLRGEIMDVVEILPGCCTKIISQIASMTGLPVIASGLLSDEEDVRLALEAGATAVSGTDSALWR